MLCARFLCDYYFPLLQIFRLIIIIFIMNFFAGTKNFISMKFKTTSKALHRQLGCSKVYNYPGSRENLPTAETPPITNLVFIEHN